MSTKVNISLSYSGIGEVLHYEELRALLAGKSTDIRTRCGNGYGNAVFRIGNRYVGRVQANTKRAKRDNLNNNTLLKNMH